MKQFLRSLLSSDSLLRMAGGRTFVLCYHHVAPRIGGVASAQYTTTTDRFEEHMEMLSRSADMVHLHEVVNAPQRRERPRIAITFDDGFRSVATVAAPMLRARGIPYALFINAAAVDHGQLWMSNVAGLFDTDKAYVEMLLRSAGIDPSGPDGASADAAIQAITMQGTFGEDFQRHWRTDRAPAGLYLTSSEIAELAREGVTIGGHSADHYVLSRCDQDTLRDQLHRGVHLIGNVQVGEPRFFAIPFGKREHYDARVVAHLREQGMTHILTTAPDRIRYHQGRAPVLVPRIGVVDNPAHELRFYLNRTLLRSYPL